MRVAGEGVGEGFGKEGHGGGGTEVTGLLRSDPIFRAADAGREHGAFAEQSLGQSHGHAVINGRRAEEVIVRPYFAEGTDMTAEGDAVAKGEVGDEGAELVFLRAVAKNLKPPRRQRGIGLRERVEQEVDALAGVETRDGGEAGSGAAGHEETSAGDQRRGL